MALDTRILLDKTKFISPAANTSSPGLGVLVGLDSGASREDTGFPLVVVGQCACVEEEKATLPVAVLTEYGLPCPRWPETRIVVSRNFPAGCVPCGVYVRLEECTADSVQTVAEALCKETGFWGSLKPSPFLLIAIPTSADETDRVQCYTVGSDSCGLQPCIDVTGSVRDFLVANTKLLRLQASFTLHLPATGHHGNTVSPLTEQLESTSTVFYLPSRQLLISEARPSASTLASVLSPTEKKAADTPLTVELLEDVNTDPSLPLGAPTLSCEPKEGEYVQLDLPVDVVAMVASVLPLSSVAVALKAAVVAQLLAMESAVHWKEDCLCSVSVHHFPLPTQLCPVTVVYPHTPLGGEEPLNDQQLLPIRQALHYTFNLPNDRPYIKTINRQCFIQNEGNWLITPHIAVKHTRIPDGTLAAVQGSYAYHHYMQDKFNDDGWGCAYRSLQTLWSWFVLQGYTTKPVPSHREIQQALVDVGDKDPSLVGSRQWIGSFEVSTCLDHLMGIVCKIHHCSSGAEMGGVGRVLIHHFRTQGTPIMIGGGVLAHTILGVDFSEKTGEIRFLILDPHYTGRDELKTIVDKGWCGWKPETFWDQQAHYNLCMPQRPVEI